MGLLTAFKLTGVLQGPPKLETLTVEGVTWKMEKPSNVTRVAETVENIHADNFASVSFSVLVDYYVNDWSYYGGKDTLLLRVCVNASVHSGFIESVNLYFREEGNYSIVRVLRDPDVITLVNLRFDSYSSMQTYIKAHLKATGINQPSEVYMDHPAIWQFLDPNNLTHLLEISLELTYRDKLVYNKVVVPISLEMYIKETV